MKGLRTGVVILSALMIIMLCLSGKAAAHEINQDLIIINKKTNKLAFFRNGVMEREFSVATGRTKALTPEGTFKIVNKIKNRPYYKEKIPGGDPSNPLGDRWLGLEVNGTYGTTYAIHGNSNPSSIGKYVSSGCIRMYNKEIHWLFDQVQLQTKVVITHSEQSFAEIADASHYALAKEIQGGFQIDGMAKEAGNSFLLYQGRMFVPFRESFELLGGTLRWDSSSKTAIAVLGDVEIIHQPGAGTAAVNGEPVELVAESYVLNETIMVPIRDIARLSGYDVYWDASTSTLALNRQVPTTLQAPSLSSPSLETKPKGPQ